jgi:rod shape-determining protein MreC
MINVPKSVEVTKGDTIVTSQYSAYRFPEGILVGIVSDIANDQGSNFYTLRIKPTTNFYNLEYVYVVENMQKNEQKKLEEETQKIK